MKENVLKRILFEGTQLIKKVAVDEISIEDFLHQYNNFYYYNALDGHEANDLTIPLFKKYSNIIDLHKDIQTSVVDLVYLSDKTDSSKVLNSGRISIDDAMQRISKILKVYNIDDLLETLVGGH
jgi:hypothetical protein